jgi:hypothetical protein
MSTLHARVNGGQVVVEGKTDLPEGTELTAGRGISGDELLARVRET